VALAWALLGAAAPVEASHAVGQGVRPVQDETDRDARALAETHQGALEGLQEEVTRCEPELDVHRHGIGFRRPRDRRASPSLALWVWVNGGRTPEGDSLAARAGRAFALHGRRLFGRLVAREAVRTDPRLGGFALVLTWFPPGRTDPPIGETLVVFGDRPLVEALVRDEVSASDFLQRARLRAFDGQDEVRLPPLSAPPGDGVVAAAGGC
jgi:hypothetical protein